MRSKDGDGTMIKKKDIKKDDVICFNGGLFLKVFEVTNRYLVVEVDQFTKKSIKLDSFRIFKLNDRYYANTRLDNILL